MACKCGKNLNRVRTPWSPSVTLQRDDQNMILTAGIEPDCTPYRGAFKRATIFVVGYGTPVERLFLYTQRAAFEEYLASNRDDKGNPPKWTRASASEFCTTAVEALLS